MAAVGILDSGVGGLSIARAAERGLLLTRCEMHTLRVAPALNIPLEEARQGAEVLLETIRDAVGPGGVPRPRGPDMTR